jgi:hypothetical protein
MGKYFNNLNLSFALFGQCSIETCQIEGYVAASRQHLPSLDIPHTVVPNNAERI